MQEACPSEHDLSDDIYNTYNETDRDEIVLQVIEERAAPGRHAERPAEGVLHQPLAVVLGQGQQRVLQ